MIIDNYYDSITKMSGGGDGVIPKVIHYCWFGKGQKTELMLRCMETWKKYCPGWKIIEWNEDNFDVEFCEYSKKAFKQKRYGFLSDAARLKIIFENGGVYLDTDVELRNPIDELCAYDAFFGYGTTREINTGSGFGAVKGCPFIKKLLDQYIHFDENAKFELCTVLDTKVFTQEFPNFAADHDVEQVFNNMIILNNIWHYVIHHYTGTWQTPMQRLFGAWKWKIIGLLRKN